MILFYNCVYVYSMLKPIAIVVAAYQENLSWIDEFVPKNGDYHVYVYHKFTPYPDLQNVATWIQQETLPNVGRESHTYLYHLLTNYDRLADYDGIIFLQGNPMEHMTDVTQTLEHWASQIREQGYTNNFHYCDMHGTHYQWKFHNYRGAPLEATAMTFGEWFESRMNGNPDTFPMKLLWYGAAQFGIAVELIKRRSKEFFDGLIQDLQTLNPEIGHFMERSWYYIMNVHHRHSIRVKRIGIQTVHGDETANLRNLFEKQCDDFYIWEFGNANPEELQKCDLLLLNANEVSAPFMHQKPYLLNIVNYKPYSYYECFATHHHFRGFLIASQELFDDFKKQNRKSFLWRKRAPLKKSVIVNDSSFKIVTMIIHYYAYSQSNIVHGMNAYTVYQNIVSHANPQYTFAKYGDPIMVPDIETIREARYLLHIKYWGHVCNAVVKALACGVPVIMDRITMESGKYGSYIRHGENGLVFDDPNEIIAFFQDLEKEAEVYARLKETCIREASNWHFSTITTAKRNLASHFLGY